MIGQPAGTGVDRGRLRTGEIADQRTGEQFDHGRQRRALVTAKGEHGALLQHGAGIVAGRALGIHPPALGQGLACATMQFDFAAGHGAGGEIEDEGRTLGPRPAEGQGIGTEQRATTTGRGDIGLGRIAGQGHQAPGGKGFHLHPERREVHAVVDRQGCQATVARLGVEQGQPRLEGQRGEAATRIDPDDGRSHVLYRRLGIGHHLAGLERLDDAQQPIDAVGGAVVTLAGDHHGGDGRALRLTETLGREHLFGQVLQVFRGHLGHGGAPSGKPRLCRNRPRPARSTWDRSCRSWHNQPWW